MILDPVENALPVAIGLIDDDASVRRGVSRLLRAAGYQVRAFHSGEDCLAAPDLEVLGCLIIDIHLGGISGFELLCKLREVGHRTPAIFITAFDESLTKDALRMAGSPVCLRKPVDADFLLSALHNHLEHQQQ